MEAELPFRAEYAKSGRSGCKGCLQKIDKGALRIAIMVQSAYFDGKQPNWHHVECFFRYARVRTIADIAGFNKLKNPDKDRIKKAIESKTGIVTPVEKGKGKKGKRAAENSGRVNPAVSTRYYSVEYSKSSRNRCVHCDIKITRGEVRIGKILFDIDIGMKGAMQWHHVQCFEAARDNLGYLAGGEDLPGFNNLSTEDQKIVKDTIRPKSVDGLPIKKTKLELIDEEDDDEDKENDLEKLLAKQNELFHKCRDALSEYKRSDLHELLIYNNLKIPTGTDRCLDSLADCMAFGVPAPCPECKGQLILRTFNYMCTGSISEWTRCRYATTDPKKTKFKVPEAFKEGSAFHKYKPSVAKRAFECEKPPPPPPVVIKEDNSTNPSWILTKSIAKSGSIYGKSGKSGTTKLKIKDGTAVDPDSGLENVAHVYKDEHGTKYTVVLCRTDVVAQKNSFYKLQVLEADKTNEYWLFRSWGRIGTTIGGNKAEGCSSLDDAVTKFENLYRERTGNLWEGRDNFIKVPGGYHPIDVDYGADDTDGARLKLQVDKNCKLPEPVQKLIVKIFDINVMKKTLLEFELDTEKMPLGKLSKKQIKSGYKVLTELLKYIEQGKASENKIKDATNRFFCTVPHDFGFHNAPLLDSVDAIMRKAEMLDNLLEIEIAYSLLTTDSEDTTSPIEQHYTKLKASISPLDKYSEEFQMILEYVTNTHAATHSGYTLEVEEVFKVVREGEDKRYKPYKNLHNRRLLWHGSRVTNFAGILSQGLRIAPPEAPVTGYMFGKGVYFADMVSKSANYCYTSRSNPTGIMLLCEVALGDMKKCHQAEMITALPAGLHSTWGVGRTQPDPGMARSLPDGTLVPLGKPVTDNKLNTSLLYNEFIVYDVAQVNVKYLLQMKFNHKY